MVLAHGPHKKTQLPATQCNAHTRIQYMYVYYIDMCIYIYMVILYHELWKNCLGPLLVEHSKLHLISKNILNSSTSQDLSGFLHYQKGWDLVQNQLNVGGIRWCQANVVRTMWGSLGESGQNLQVTLVSSLKAGPFGGSSTEVCDWPKGDSTSGIDMGSNWRHIILTRIDPPRCF